MTREFRALRTKDFKFSPNLFLLSLSLSTPSFAIHGLSSMSRSSTSSIVSPGYFHRELFVTADAPTIVELSFRINLELVDSYFSLSPIFRDIKYVFRRNSCEQNYLCRYSLFSRVSWSANRPVNWLLGGSLHRPSVEARRDRPKEENRFVGRLDRTYVRTYRLECDSAVIVYVSIPFTRRSTYVTNWWINL